MYDVVALGELLIDFINTGIDENNNPKFTAYPGGAPCNVLAMLNKLGHKICFIGKVGADSFGNHLKSSIEKAGISSDGLIFDETLGTTLAFVHKLPNGDRDFSFYRNPSADVNIQSEEVNYDLISDSKIFHFGTLSLTDEPAISATKSAVDFAVKKSKLISFDPNLREPLWKNLEDAKSAMWYGIEKCDVLKIADNEIKWLTGIDDYDSAVAYIKKSSKAKLINVTLGKDGSIAYYGNTKQYCKGFVNDNTVDTTGAGDTFCACVLSYIINNSIENLTQNNLIEMLRFANAAASIITNRAGALMSMPSLDEIKDLLNKNQM